MALARAGRCPSSPKRLPWHGQAKPFFSSCATLQPRWVQMAENDVEAVLGMEDEESAVGDEGAVPTGNSPGRPTGKRRSGS